jgi:hypothetical protein
VLAAAASLLVAAVSGCGLVSKAKNFASNVAVLTDIGSKLKDSSSKTYTAVYSLDGGRTVTVANQPPKSAYRGINTTFISLPNGTWTCQKGAGHTVCTETVPIGAGALGGLGTGLGEGLVTPEIAVGLLAAATLVPDAKITKSERTIAGQKSTCAKVTGLTDSQKGKDAKVKDFSVCVTGTGVLGSFEGTLDNDKAGKTELTKYTTTVDAKLFALPAGAKIVRLPASPSAK